MLVLQGIIVTFLATVFLVLPDVSSSFWVLIALASILYSAMYVIMFITAIKLRYSQPNVERPYKIGLGNAGMWVVSTLGALVSLFVIVVGFLPPDHIVNKGRYVTILLSGFFIFLLTQFFILMFKNPNWNVDKDKVTEGELKS
jgi:amino acid transporter